jgi:ribosomal-protein-serine acetyltransferase
LRYEYTDGVIRIRPCRKTDAREVYEAVRESLDELMPFMPWCHPDYSLEDTRTFLALCSRAWAEETEFNFSILDRKGDFLGLCGINHINPIIRYANLGYWVRSSGKGQGVATRGARLVAMFGFRQLKLLRLEIVVDLNNPASQRVAEKTGAAREGVLRNRILFNTESRDAVMFSLIPSDLQNAEWGPKE